MDFKQDVKKNIKDFIAKNIPEDSLKRIMSEGDLDEYFNDISLTFEELEKKYPDDSSREEFIFALKIGIDLGIRYGMLSFADKVAQRANAILNTENSDESDSTE